MNVDVTSMDSSTLSSQTMLMKLGDNVYGDTPLCLLEDESRPPPRGHVTPEKHAFWGCF